MKYRANKEIVLYAGTKVQEKIPQGAELEKHSSIAPQGYVNVFYKGRLYSLYAVDLEEIKPLQVVQESSVNKVDEQIKKDEKAKAIRKTRKK